MLKKRFVGVVTLRNGWAVQSFGYRRYLPIGRPTVVIENLDRWGVDEILILDTDRSANDLGPDFGLLCAISNQALSTPLVYGGGIRSVEQASQVIKCGVERVCVDTALHGDRGALQEIASHIGSQALIASLPLAIAAGELKWYNHVTRTQRTVDATLYQLFEGGLISEALVIDWQNEGTHGGFDMNLLNLFPVPDLPIIAFGGLSEMGKLKEALDMPCVVAVGVGNALNFTEHSVQKYKESLGSVALRPSEYQEMFR